MSMKKRFRPKGLRAVGLGVVGLTALHSANATTQITFGGFTADNTDISSLPGYGSNVTADSVDYTVSAGVAVVGTPDIGLTWGAGYQTYTAWDGRGNVAQTDFNSANPIDLVFTPSGGSSVLLQSFDLDQYAGGGAASVNWQVFDSIGTLASGTWTQTDAGGRNTILTGLTSGDVHAGNSVTLRLQQTSGAASYVALDNLTFDQVQPVPEPSILAMSVLGLGLGAAAMRRRRN